jgi:hypothetical protein
MVSRQFHAKSISNPISLDRKESGLPIYDIFPITGLPKSASLPVTPTQQTKLRLKEGK